MSTDRSGLVKSASFPVFGMPFAMLNDQENVFIAEPSYICPSHPHEPGCYYARHCC